MEPGAPKQDCGGEVNREFLPGIAAAAMDVGRRKRSRLLRRLRLRLFGRRPRQASPSPVEAPAGPEVVTIPLTLFRDLVWLQAQHGCMINKYLINNRDVIPLPAELMSLLSDREINARKELEEYARSRASERASRNRAGG